MEPRKLNQFSYLISFRFYPTVVHISLVATHYIIFGICILLILVLLFFVLQSSEILIIGLLHKFLIVLC